jgi:hypothetical protein
MNPIIRTGLTHVGTATGGGLAATMFLATKSGDVLAIYDQLNVIVADVMKLVALATPIATAAYGIYKATTKSKLQDLEQDKRFKGAVVSPDLAVQLGPKVQSDISELPAAARATSRASFIG